MAGVQVEIGSFPACQRPQTGTILLIVLTFSVKPALRRTLVLPRSRKISIFCGLVVSATAPVKIGKKP